MLDFLHQVLRAIFMMWGILFILSGFAAVIRSFSSTDHMHQADRVRRAVMIGVGVALLAPGVTLVMYGFSTDRIMARTIFMIILSSICFSPIGLAAILLTYYRLWGLPKIKDDLAFLSDKLNRKR